MFRRRRRHDDTSRAEQPGAATEQAQPAEPTAATGTPKPDGTNGPFDISELDPDEARAGRVDLGGMLIKGVEGMKVQLQVDKRSGRGTSVLLAIKDAAVQLVAVAAPRSSGMWEQTRLQLAEDANRRGGNVQEGSGPFGTEVRLVVPVTTKDGKQGHQPSRVSGIDGPRWMLRATFLGKAITDAAVFQQLVEIVRQVVVVRGDVPMPPGEVIPLQAPSRGGEGESDDESVPTITDTAMPGAVPAEPDQ